MAEGKDKKWEYINDVPLFLEAKRELGTMADTYCLMLWLSNNDKGYCYASEEYLACQLGLKKNAIAKQKKELEKLGYIRREKGERSPDGSIPCHIYPLKKYPNVNNYTRADVNNYTRADVNSSNNQMENFTSERKSIKKEIERGGSVSDDTQSTPSKNKSSKSTNQRKRFVPPTIDDVKAYREEKNLNVDPVQFINYYEAGEWKDKNGKAVKNWKQKMQTWNNHQKGSGAVGQQYSMSGGNTLADVAMKQAKARALDSELGFD